MLVWINDTPCVKQVRSPALCFEVTSYGLHFHFSFSCAGEGNGNPLQCSCLENPRDGGAWWAAIYAVVQSWTQLKRLSSSSIWFMAETLSGVYANLPVDLPGGSDGKASANNVGDLGSILGQEDLLEKEMASHSSILAWIILWTEEPGRLQSMGS